ncbi:flavin reductase family protein [Campylobacter sp. RM16188]|uniref:flavin reductase family protein n=1 Tax=Campylobacter sp. RM16188 TaxID=1705725 RepID=UPI00155324AB|nr:flavin reductase family protein [Campylobacter sp. RM16188]
MIKKVEPAKAYRLVNTGPTCLISAKFDGIENAMSASWVCALDYDKISVVVDSGAFTRSLIEKSGYFAVSIPCVKQANLVMKLGSISRHQNAAKMQDVRLFYQNSFDVPLVSDCIAWLVCKVLTNKQNQSEFDLFMGDIVGAWADEQVFKDGRWKFDECKEELRSLHYVVGGEFYTLGKRINVKI